MKDGRADSDDRASKRPSRGAPSAFGSSVPAPTPATPPSATLKADREQASVATAAAACVFHPEATLFADLDSAEKPNPTAVDAYDTVRALGELNVLFAPEPLGDSRIHTWSELKALADGEVRRAWDDWLQPGHWHGLINGIYAGRLGVKPVGEGGAYNMIVEPGACTPVDDPRQWPPQLKSAGVETFGVGVDDLVMPNKPYVIRLTAPDLEYTDEDTKQKKWRVHAACHSDAVREAANCLRMASLGVGPAVYAAMVFPWGGLSARAATTDHRWGLMVVMEKGDHDLKRFVYDTCVAFPPKGALRIYPQAFAARARGTAAQIVNTCYLLACDGCIHFDIKTGNIIKFGDPAVFRFIDFDGNFFRRFGFDVAGRKACFFVTLLLTCMQVRAHTTSAFAKAFMDIAGPPLMELWQEALETPSKFGPGWSWLTGTTLTRVYTEGKFDVDRIEALPNAYEKAGVILKCMVFEYFLNTDPDAKLPQTAVEWKGWKEPGDGGFFCVPKLVPQMLVFALFHARNVPDKYRELLKY